VDPADGVQVHRRSRDGGRDDLARSYDAWKRVYDSAAALRRKAGIIGTAVNRSLDNPNEFLVYHQAETQAQLEAYFASPELEATMKSAGVKGAPMITYVQALSGATY
jgi:quinol monooxygenase YgiN